MRSAEETAKKVGRFIPGGGGRIKNIGIFFIGMLVSERQHERYRLTEAESPYTTIWNT
jgi:hypothetical protein